MQPVHNGKGMSPGRRSFFEYGSAERFVAILGETEVPLSGSSPDILSGRSAGCECPLDIRSGLTLPGKPSRQGRA